ncbi:MAG: ATP-binding protein [Fimbriimonadales bacterium]
MFGDRKESPEEAKPLIDPQLAALLAAVTDTVIHVGPDRKVIRCWPGQLSQDLKVPTLAGMHLGEIFARSGGDVIEASLAEAFRTGETQTVDFSCQQSSQPTSCRARIAPCEDGTAMVVVSKSLSHSTDSDWRQLLLEAIPDPIFHLDKDGRYLGYNFHDPGNLYVSPEHFIGRLVSEVMPPDITEANMNAIAAAIETGMVQTFRYKSPLREKYFEVRVVPAPDEQVVQIVRDITGIKQVEDELDRRVRERTSELEAANRELEAFCYSASHDLRTPLRSINGFSQLLAQELGHYLTEDSVDHLRRIQRATLRMDAIINDMLRLAGVVRAAMSIEEVDLSGLAKEALEDLHEAEPQRRVAVEIEQGLKCRGDAALLQLMLANLIGNAWKFTRTVEQPRIAFGFRNGAYFVEDNGIGFDPSFLGRMFRPFERLHTQEEFPGNGIGLATVKRIIERHGGRIWAEGAPGRGATFCFTLER